MLYGVLNLSFWTYVLVTLILGQLTLAATTLYLHRCQAHRAISLHPLVSHFFRLWLWLTTGMVTAQWVAVHRKHHARVDEKGDPHSPVVFGLKKILLYGAELYREAAADKDLVEKYGHGTPDDWVERNIYSRHPSKGILFLFFIYLVLFGLPGISIWALQMLWIPVHAAGIINGLGHYLGYRNFESTDASRNILPWGLWIGGEELHNNHHAFASSAKFSIHWWEIDIGWIYICCLRFFKLARVKKLPPKLAFKEGKTGIDIETVKALIHNRMQVMVYFYKNVAKPVLKMEKQTSARRKLLQGAGRLFRLQESMLSSKSRQKLHQILANNSQLSLVYQYKQALQNVWLKTAATQKELVEALQVWCKQAESSGLEVLELFVKQVKTYVPQRI